MRFQPNRKTNKFFTAQKPLLRILQFQSPWKTVPEFLVSTLTAQRAISMFYLPETKNNEKEGNAVKKSLSSTALCKKLCTKVCWWKSRWKFNHFFSPSSHSKSCHFTPFQDWDRSQIHRRASYFFFLAYKFSSA